MGTESAMYDIFMRFPDGTPLWLEAVEGLDEARQRLAALARTSEAAEYFIYSEKSGGIIDADRNRITGDEVYSSAGASRIRVRLHN